MKNKYSLSEFVKTIYSVLITKIIIPQARLIRRPVYIRGIKSLEGCNGLTTGRFCRFDLNGKKKTLFIGDNCEFGDMVHIVAHEMVEIGNNVLIASKVFISDTNHGNYKDENQSSPDQAPKERKLICKPVYIGDNVWIGENAVILGGVKIENGCIVGANSVVCKDLKENSIVGGVPSKTIKRYNHLEMTWNLVK